MNYRQWMNLAQQKIEQMADDCEYYQNNPQVFEDEQDEMEARREMALEAEFMDMALIAMIEKHEKPLSQVTPKLFHPLIDSPYAKTFKEN